MGFLDSVKDALGGGESSEDIAGEFEDEFSGGSEDTIESGIEETEEEEILEWDTAYRFAEDMLEEEGFSNMKEFIDKAMIYRINMSPLYRDKMESGIEMMDRISSSMERIQGIRGEENGVDRSYSEMVEDIRAANNLIDEIDRMGGKEEEIVNELIGIGRDIAQGYREGTSGSSAVDTGMEVTEEEI